jgi:hypothetical protein
MKLANIALILFPIAAFGTPIASPDVSPNTLTGRALGLEARADKWCSLGVSSAQGCDADPWGSQRKVTVNPGDNFGVRCWSHARSVQGNDVWDYVPGWDCWISALWTNVGCESKYIFPF